MKPVLLAPVNFSCGRDPEVVDAIASECVGAGAELLDVHCDVDHDRAVITLAARQGDLAGAVVAGAAKALDSIDLSANVGVHPRVGVVDVAPIVHVTPGDRGAACAEALVLADGLGSGLGLPVFLYGLLADGRTRAELRSGGAEGLGERISAGLLAPDFGPGQLEPGRGAALVAARPPIVAFNLVLGESATLSDARSVASAVREGGSSGLEGVRALGLSLPEQGIVQLSANLERPDSVGIRELHAAVADLVPVVRGELVGLAPRGVLDRIPDDLAMPGFDPDLQSIEGSLRFHRLID